MTTCCGQERESMYCPDCGTALIGVTPMGSLLLHLCKQRRKAELALNKSRDFAVDNTPEGQSMARAHSAQINRDARGLAKWTAWADGLRKLIAGQEASKPDTEGST